MMDLEFKTAWSSPIDPDSPGIGRIYLWRGLILLGLVGANLLLLLLVVGLSQIRPVLPLLSAVLALVTGVAAIYYWKADRTPQAPPSADVKVIGHRIAESLPDEDLARLAERASLGHYAQISDQRETLEQARKRIEELEGEQVEAHGELEDWRDSVGERLDTIALRIEDLEAEMEDLLKEGVGASQLRKKLLARRYLSKKREYELKSEQLRRALMLYDTLDSLSAISLTTDRSEELVNRINEYVYELESRATQPTAIEDIDALVQDYSPTGREWQRIHQEYFSAVRDLEEGA